MTYQEALTYIEEIGQYGSVLGLDNIRELLRRLGNPQEQLSYVHIAGTNGKGSTLAFISTILTCAKYRVGSYISPTIFDYRERIQINEAYIAKRDLGHYMEIVKQACDEMIREQLPHPTPFEVETALAFLYFKEKKCDIVVLETGLGGTLDATNVIENTLAAVITSVSMDHMTYLGNSIEEIAKKKAGIIKKGSCVIVLNQDDKVMKVMEEESSEKKAILKKAEVNLATGIQYGMKKQVFSYKNHKKMEISLLGKYQIANAVTAIETIDALMERGFTIKESDIRKGLWETKWAGRCSIIAENPIFMADGAHNEDAAQKLAESIAFYFTNKKIIYIMGILKDKEYEKIVKATYSYAAHIITVTPPNNPRAMHAYDLAQTVKEYHPSVTAADSLEEAAEMAYLLADKESVIVAFGSLSYLGELIKIVENRQKLKFTL